MSRKIIVVALGGNAIIEDSSDAAIGGQFARTRKSMQSIVRLISQGHRVILTHGNGPQAGAHLIRHEAAAGQVPPSPLNVIVADTQGSMGYMIAQCLANAFTAAGIVREVVTVVTQVIVDPDDPSMTNPTKYVGPSYAAGQVETLTAQGWTIREDRGRGFRRVVPSPVPLDIVEKRAIKELMERGRLVIAAGGGGVPVMRRKDGTLSGVDAVVDKDRASALLASLVGADELCILTGVDKVAINYRRPGERLFDSLTVAECQRYLADGQFPAGSMGPKIEAACDFIRRGGRKVVIQGIESTQADLSCHAGTVITA